MATTPWKDGAQFTKEMKADYCVRAMQSILQSAMMPLRSLPHDIAASIMERMFPGAIAIKTDTSDVIDVPACFVLGATAITTSGSITRETKVPILSVASTANIAYGRQWLAPSQVPDQTAYVTKNATPPPTLSVNFVGAAGSKKVFYIEAPPRLIDNTGNTEMTDNVRFDPLWHNEIIKRASVYAYIDNQTTDTLQGLQANDSFYQLSGQ
jgi:hypothetical protein